jgi:hypothetical protein
MSNFNLPERRKKIILFGILLSVTMGLVFLLASSLTATGNKETTINIKPNKANDENIQLIRINEGLQSKLAALQSLDKQFAESITSENFITKSDSINGLIQLQEAALATAIEQYSQQENNFTDTVINEGINKMIAAYKATLDSRTANSKMRNALAMQNSSFSTDEKAMLTMQDALSQTESMISELKNTLKLQAKTNSNLANGKNDNNAELSKNISTLENTLAALTASNNSLKNDHDRLLKQQNENSKNAGTNETMLKEKTVALQQKVDALNTELQLAQVDCNLSRVDAAQIISNAKQRKQLLSEASYILTNLSATANDDVKKKVKDKIVRLNQVAANSRE